ncbi:MAG: hypothetical protein V9G14_11090 [Cypionkella sp.]
MRKSAWPASLGLHAAILVAALVVLPDPNPYKIKPQEAIQVDISNIGDVSKTHGHGDRRREDREAAGAEEGRSRSRRPIPRRRSPKR